MTDSMEVHQKRQETPNDFTLGEGLEIPLLNIHNRLRRNENIQKQILDVQFKSQQIFKSIETVQFQIQRQNQNIFNSTQSAQLYLDNNERIQQQLLETQLKNQQILINIEMAQLKNEKTQQQLLETQLKSQQIFNNIEITQLQNEKIQQQANIAIQQLLEIQLKSQQILSNIEMFQLQNERTLIDIYKLEKDRTDEGNNIVKNNVLIQPDIFTVLDMTRDPGHSVKSAFIRNDGPNSIFVSYNASIDGINPAIEDLKSNTSRFVELKVNEEKKWNFNIRTIYVIHIIVNPDVVKKNPKATSTCRIELAW